MAQTPSFFQNNPVSGTQYFSDMGHAGCIPANAANVTITVKAWSGQNGTGALVQVTTLACNLWDQTTQASKNTNSGNFNTVTASSAAWNGTDLAKAAGTFTGVQSVGSLEMFLTYTGTAFVPTQPSFSPASGSVGTSVTLTGSRFTDAATVTLNGTSCAFSVTNDTTISATVPTGATTGPFVVGNASGTSPNSASSFLVSNVWVFRSSAWVAGPAEIDRSGVQTVAQVFVFRSSVWTASQ